jgi:hypothetical protein
MEIITSSLFCNATFLPSERRHGSRCNRNDAQRRDAAARASSAAIKASNTIKGVKTNGYFTGNHGCALAWWSWMTRRDSTLELNR